MEKSIFSEFPNLRPDCRSENLLEINIESATQELQDGLEIVEGGASIDKCMENLLTGI